MRLAFLAIAIYHSSVLQAVQKKINMPGLTKNRKHDVPYIFNEPQMTLLFILSTFMIETCTLQWEKITTE